VIDTLKVAFVQGRLVTVTTQPDRRGTAASDLKARTAAH